MKKKKIKQRSFEALSAWNRPSAGQHKNKKRYNRKQSKKVVDE